VIHCQRCGAELPPGSLKFLVTIHVTADFDGVLPAQGSLEDLEAFMAQLDAEDPVKLEKDVHQSQGYVLCPACKGTFVDDPLGLAREGEKAEAGRVH
jgi:hypothetical protein